MTPGLRGPLLARKDVGHAEALSQKFRYDVVTVACKGQVPLKQIAKDFGVSEGCLHNWMKAADIEDGHCPGVTETSARKCAS